MNTFKILNAEGKALTMEELDKDAAAFWGKEVDPEHYANPFPKEKGAYANALNNAKNWYDIIGWNIANIPSKNVSWYAVAHEMTAEYIRSCIMPFYDGEPIEIAEFVGDNETHLEESCETSLFYTLNFYRPFIDLINHWMAKGYTPVKIECKIKK